ncbi:hypothetical protein Tco_1082022 [Tanacetum coccineum]|uniref:Uncharacterized protein n=1 Tax=Tanacetum coccineum TaxID=301880 RepID=A0ABQ5I0W2_9ASTR
MNGIVASRVSALTGCDRLVSEPRKDFVMMRLFSKVMLEEEGMCGNVTTCNDRMMSTPVFVDLEISTQADGSQSSRVPVPLPKDPYEDIRQTYLDGTDTESEPFEDPVETETPDMTEMAAMSESAFRKRFRSYYESSPSLSPLDLPLRKRYRGTFELVEDDEENDEIEESLATGVEGPGTDDESYGLDDESHGMDDESRGLDDEGHSVESDGLGLEEEEEAVPGGQQQAAPVVGTAVSAPLGLGYGALRRRELALEEDHVYSTFEVGQGSGSAPESERLNPEDGMVYIDVPAYPPPAPPVQTPPSPEWTSGSLPISPSPSVVPSPISSPMIPLTVPSPVATPATAETEGFLTELGAQVEMQGGLIRDHAVRLEELSPALFERYDRDIGELFTRSGAVRDEIFSQRYRFRSLEYEQERVAVTFGAIWRPVLALESWAGQTDAQRAALWHAISDMQGENQDLRLQLAEERRARFRVDVVVGQYEERAGASGGAYGFEVWASSLCISLNRVASVNVNYD